MFYSEQQRLILARLKHSADRQTRLRRPATAAESTRVTVNPVVVAVEEQVPAPIAAFLLPKPEMQSSGWELAFLPAIWREQEAAFRPRPLVILAGYRFCPLVPDFPWPRYNPGLQSVSESLLEGTTFLHRFPSLEYLGFVSAFAFDPSGLLASRRPEVANGPIGFIRPALRLARPKSSVALSPVRLRAS